MARWDAEHPVDLEQARELISAQLPDLPLDDLTHLGSGWDNDVFRSGDLLFRFPRRAVGVTLLEIERWSLPLIAPRLPAPVPMMLREGRPSPSFPHLFLCCRFVHGTPLDRLDGRSSDGRRLAEGLALFLRALHSIPLLGPLAELPTQRRGGDHTPMGVFARQCLKRQSMLAEAPLLRRADAALAVAQPPVDTAPWVVCHGDLHIRHVLVDPTGALAGVIDWGDIVRGERALDLAAVFAALDPPAREVFWDCYGPVTAAERRLAWYYALAKHVILLVSSHEMGLSHVVRAAETAIGRTLKGHRSRPGPRSS